LISQGKVRDEPTEKSSPPTNHATMSLCVLDISEALTNHRVHWLPGEANCSGSSGSPEEAVLYSIVHGRAELIVFGGVQKFIATQATTNAPGNGGPNIVSNAVYFIRAPKPII